MSPASSSWEQHKLLVAGLRKLSVISLVLVAAAIGADFALFRNGRPEGELSGWVARVALGVSFVAALVTLGLALVRKAELGRPVMLATGLTLLVVFAGALETLASGGLHGYFLVGLLPLLFFWPAVMPGGIRTSVVAVLGSVVLQGTVLFVAGDLDLIRLGIFSVFAAGVVLAYARQLERMRQQVAAGSRVDSLTGSMSWNAIVEELEVLCARRSRHWSPLTLVMFDVDRFERINDKYGRLFGDEVLELLDSTVRGETRDTDYFGRRGADEFLLVLDVCDSQQAVVIVDRIRARLANTPLKVGEEDVRITFSAGIVTAPKGEPIVAASLIKAAENALQGSKQAQLNQTNLGAAEKGAPTAVLPVRANAPAPTASSPLPPPPPAVTAPPALAPPESVAAPVVVAPTPPPSLALAAQEAPTQPAIAAPAAPEPANAAEIWKFPPAPPRVPVPPPPDDEFEEAQIVDSE